MLHDWLIAPLLEFSFMRHGLAVVVLIGLTSSVLSCLLVVRRQSLMGDAVAHSVLLGVVVGWMVGREAGIFTGAMAAGLLTAMAITFIERNSRIRFDAALGIVFTFAFALALAIISAVKPKGIDLFHVLLGNVLAVGPAELAATALCSVVVLGLLTLFFNGYHFWSFDPVGAHAAGLNTAWFHYTFTAMLAATIVTSIQAVGLVLVIAMLVTPGATANLLTERLKPMMVVAAGVGVVASVMGLYGSYHADIASGPAIVVVASLLFFAAFVLAPRRGLLARWRAQRALHLAHAGEDALRALAVAREEQDREMTLSELALQLRWTLRVADAVVRALQEQGHVGALRPVVTLTLRGQAEGRQLTRKHRMLERYLHDMEGVALEAVHDAADAIEHGVSAQDLHAMDAQLGSPQRDPHGHIIPPRDAPNAPRPREPSDTLWCVPEGSAVRVVSLCDSDRTQLSWLVDQGLLPGRACHVLRRSEETMDVNFEGRQLQVPGATAQLIRVVPLRLVQG